MAIAINLPITSEEVKCGCKQVTAIPECAINFSLQTNRISEILTIKLVDQLGEVFEQDVTTDVTGLAIVDLEYWGLDYFSSYAGTFTLTAYLQNGTQIQMPAGNGSWACLWVNFVKTIA